MRVTVENGVTLCQRMEPVLREIGYHCALTGSCLFKGESEKDIDIICYPHKDEEKKHPVDVLIHLTKMGLMNDYKKYPAYEQPGEGRSIFICKYHECRVDMFFFT